MNQPLEFAGVASSLSKIEPLVLLQEQREVFRVRARSQNRNQLEIQILRTSIEGDAHFLIDPMRTPDFPTYNTMAVA